MWRSIGLNAHYLIIGYLPGLLYERIYVDGLLRLLYCFLQLPSPGSADAGLSVFYQVCRTCELWVYQVIYGGIVYRSLHAFYLLLDVSFVSAEVYEKKVAVQEKITLLLFYLSRT